MYPLINSGSVRLADMVRKFRPDAEIPDHPVYWQVYRHCKALARLGYVRIEKREKVDWEATNAARMDEIEKSVHSIFDNAVRKDTPPIVSSGALTGEAQQQISTVKITENGFYVVPTENLFALINRVQNSNHFLDPAKSRREMQEVREKTGTDFAKLKMQRKRPCPYYVSVRTKHERMEAIWKLRGIRRHSMFKRRDKTGNKRRTSPRPRTGPDQF